jgi:uncharacterized SAM-binding protein YcdF (DUF218 family)
MESLIGLVLLWLLWLISSRRWQRKLVVPIVMLAFGLVLTSPVGLAIGQRGLTAALPADTGEAVDAIVVLGRGYELRDPRIEQVWELWRSRRASQVFASGMLDARPIVQVLKDLGIPEPHISGEECSQSTQENALFTTAILHRRGVKKILLVTDTPHMLRALLTFQHFGFHVIPAPVNLPTQLTPTAKFQILLREYAGLLKYKLTGQFDPYASNVQEILSPDIFQKIRDWNCTQMML